MLYAKITAGNRDPKMFRNWTRWLKYFVIEPIAWGQPCHCFTKLLPGRIPCAMWKSCTRAPSRNSELMKGKNIDICTSVYASNYTLFRNNEANTESGKILLVKPTKVYNFCNWLLWQNNFHHRKLFLLFNFVFTNNTITEQCSEGCCYSCRARKIILT